MTRFVAATILTTLSLVTPVAAAGSETTEPFFLVNNVGLILINSNGGEKERLKPYSVNGAFSPDGKWLACMEFPEQGGKAHLAIISRGRTEARHTVPLIFGVSGSSCLPVWASDSKRVLIWEHGTADDGKPRHSVRVFELATKQLSELRLPDEPAVTGWSPDGKRLLATVKRPGPERSTPAVAWINLDGSGTPDFITSTEEVAYSARLSPDGRKILCLAGPKVGKGEKPQPRLCVIDLSNKKRTVVDEPGHTHGHCWSPDGSKIAYTWQRPLVNPEDIIERETFLLTCYPDGSNRKIVTFRRDFVSPNSSGRSGVIIFFQLFDWR